MPVFVYFIPLPPGINIIIPGNREQAELSCPVVLEVFIVLCIFSSLLLINTADLLLNGGHAACSYSPISKSAV